MSRPITIAFEGGEGSGKDSVIEDVKKHLEECGLTVKVVREPGGCKVAEQLREILIHEDMCGAAELFLLMSARAQLHDELNKELDGVDILIKNRSFISSMVYQGAVRGIGTYKVAELIEMFSEYFDKLDYSILMDVDALEGLRRAKNRADLDRFESEGLEFHKKVNKSYRDLFEMNALGNIMGKRHIIDANKSYNEVKKNTIDLVCKMIAENN